jgi:hypothetical protein
VRAYGLEYVNRQARMDRLGNQMRQSRENEVFQNLMLFFSMQSAEISFHKTTEKYVRKK